VLSTLHTNSAAGALPRLFDMKIEPFLIASTVTAIISQRLVRRIAGEPEVYKLTKTEIQELKKSIDLDRMALMLIREKAIPEGTALGDIEWARPRPSPGAPDGYKGRIGIHEVLAMSETIRELMMKNATSDDIEKQAREEGMITMLEEGFIRAAQHVTTLEEILRVTNE